MHQPLQRFISGLSGIELPIPKYQFPPEFENASRLTYYASFFNSIEINNSFYKIPMMSTVKRWSASVPDQFKFTFKLFRDVTHVKHLEFEAGHISRFMETISHVGSKKGCVLVQFPPSLDAAYLHQLERILVEIRACDPDGAWKVAVEFRNKGWYNDDVRDLLQTHDASVVIHDIRASATPLFGGDADFVYVRFHGPTGNYRGSYTDSFLQEYATYINEWITEGKTVYVYFNNTAGDAFNNAQLFKSFVL